jgi:hypothetical protein
VAGRITDFGMLRAFVLAAQQVGFNLILEASTMLTVTNIERDIERFPALLFLPKKDQNSNLMLEDAKFYLEG